MIKEGISVVRKKEINYLKIDGKIMKFKPWLGDLLSFHYDAIMKKSIFPKKFNADIKKHEKNLENIYSAIQDSTVLELACGSGNLSNLLNRNNRYSGVDISPGLIRISFKKFISAGFDKPQFYISDAANLPFTDDYFDICICNLSLNFFQDTAAAAEEIKRIIKPGGAFYCSVPVPERKPAKSIIWGTLPSAAELETVFTNAGFSFTEYNIINGAVFYFKAVKK